MVKKLLTVISVFVFIIFLVYVVIVPGNVLNIAFSNQIVLLISSILIAAAGIKQKENIMTLSGIGIFILMAINLYLTI